LRLRGKGKPAKVAPVATMRKLLLILNLMIKTALFGIRDASTPKTRSALRPTLSNTFGGLVGKREALEFQDSRALSPRWSLAIVEILRRQLKRRA
jgi:hypothetical protein